MRRKSKKMPLLAETREQLLDCADVIYQTISIPPNIECTIVYLDSIVDQNILQNQLIPALLEKINLIMDQKMIIRMIENGNIFSLPTQAIKEVNTLTDGILQGKVALFFSHIHKAFLIEQVTKYLNRGPQESRNELVIIGPQEAFSEDMNTNMSLLRHRIKHPDFKMKTYQIGKYSRTHIRLFYIEHICPEELVNKMDRMLQKIDLDNVPGVSAIGEYIEKHPFSPFPQYQHTERPDTLVANLLEGRIGIMVDGTPLSLIYPITFFSLMQSAEDYYQRFLATSWIRWIRLLFVIISFLLPSAYVAITTFHPEMLPSNLLITIAAARENTPLPSLIEALIMEITFEGLREAGIRVPKPIGQTISIIGAIVIGQSAVQAGIVSAPIVIVVSLTGIASFIIPHFELGLAFRLLRFVIMILGGTLGLFGLIVGIFLIFYHMVTLESHGMPYMHPLAPLVWQDWRDIFVRAPWPLLKKSKTLWPSQRVKRS